MKKFFLTVFLLFLAVLALIYTARETLIRKGFESAVTALTGFETHVGNIHLQFPQAVIHLENLKIYNPKSFKKEIFADVPEIYVAPDLVAILRKESLHFREIRFAVKELNVVKNENGVSNLEMLTAVSKSAKNQPEPKPLAVAKPAMPFRLDRLELTLRKVSFEDYSAGFTRGMISKKVSMDLKVEKQVFENLTDPKAIVNVVLVKVLYGTTFGNLVGIDPRQLTKDLTKVMGVGREALVQTTDEMLQTSEHVVRNTVVSAEGILAQATQVMDKGGLGQTPSKVRDKTGIVVKETLGQAKQEIAGIFGKFKSKLNTQSDSSETTASNSESAR